MPHTLYSAQGPNAVNLYAKGAVAYIGMLQQLVLVGSGQGELQTMMAFADRAATYLQQQVDFYTNATNMLPAIQASSSVPYNDGVMEARSACTEDAVLDTWDGTHVCVHSSAYHHVWDVFLFWVYNSRVCPAPQWT